jgi:hypothetical protein
MESSALLFVWLFLWSGASVAEQGGQFPLLTGQDMHVRSGEMTSFTSPPSPWDHIMRFSGGVNVTVGDNRLSGKEGFVWLKVQGGSSYDISHRFYQAYLYLEGNVLIEQGPRSKTTALKQATVQGADALATQFLVTGEVFAVSLQRDEAPFGLLRSEPGYQRGLSALSPLAFGPGISKGAQVPMRPHSGLVPAAAGSVAPTAGATKSADGPAAPSVGAVPATTVEQVRRQTVHVASASEPMAEIKKTTLPDGREVIIASGRFYLWHKPSEDRMIEFMADNIVLYLDAGQFEAATERRGSELGRGQVRTAYLSGNIVLTESERTVRADEIFYDFANQRALIVNASMRMFDERRGLPIYLRAEKLGRVSQNLFEAENVQLTSSEFYLPQVSLNASRMVLLTEEQSVEQRDTAAQDRAATYDGRLYDVHAKYGDFTFFRWPHLRTNFVRPDMPLSRIRIGNDSDYGTFLETRWHLARLLGLKEIPGVDSRFALDYFSKRGYGTGIDAEYKTDDSIGSFIGYIMKDRGDDDLGRTQDRQNIDPEQDIRGRFSFRHRQYLPDNWQMTVETSYISDRNFLEWMYRDEFYSDKNQETLVYLKRIWDNQGVSILGKVRLNDFETMTEELPTVEYHRTGQSFWDHQLTWYSDTQVSRLRERFDEDGPRGKGGFYSYAYTRNEVDLPLTLGSFKLVPFAAGSYGFEDREGFDRDLRGNDVGRESNVFLGETGVRGSTMFWKEDPSVRSSFWDVRGLRHIVTPYFETAAYQPSDSAIDMRDYFHAGVSQRWQTHRGGESTMQSVDWMRLDVNGTWVRDGADSDIGPVGKYGPAWFAYNDPSIPFLLRRDKYYYGVVRDSLNADYEWRVSETFTLLSDANYDIESGHLQQLNVGVSRFVFPDISYYVGSRYLRPIIVEVPADDIYEKGSHSVIGAITWQVSPRYTATFAQEYNFDFGQNVRSELTIVRQYHRMFYAVSFSIDESLNRNAVMFSIWPQGVNELGVGSRRYTGLTGAMREE